MRVGRKRSALALAVVMLALALAACTQEPSRSAQRVALSAEDHAQNTNSIPQRANTSIEPPTRPAQPPAHALLDVHQRADAALAAGNKGAALKILESALEEGSVGITDPDEARRLKQDLYFRMAAISLSAGKFADAEAAAQAGLALGDGQDVFAVNLLIVHAQALRALGREQEASQNEEIARDLHDSLVP